MPNPIRVKAHDAAGRTQLARYLIRTPFALEKMTYDNNTGMVIYRSQLHATLKRNFQLLPAVKWLTLLLAHIPDRYEHRVRYYGRYSNRGRGERNAAASAAASATPLRLDQTPRDRQSKAHWARRIQKVDDADPLTCPQCGHAMRILAVIDAPAVIRPILTHLRLWRPKPNETDPPARDPPSATAPGVALGSGFLLRSTSSIPGLVPPASDLQGWRKCKRIVGTILALQSWPSGATLPLTYHPVPHSA